MSEKAKNVKKKNVAVSVEQMSASFSGPLPPPNILSGYEKVLPGSADRIIKMAETQIAHRQGLEKEVIKSNIKNEKVGMWLAFSLTVLLLLIGFYLILNEKDGVVAYLLVFGPVVFHAGNYIYNKKREKEIESESE